MVFGHWRIVCANYSSVSSVSSLCISPTSFMSSAQPVGRKSRELEVKNAMATGGIKGLWCRPAYSLYVCAPNCLSSDSRSCHNCVPIRMSRPHYPSHTDEQQPREMLGNTTRQYRWCQMLASSQNGHEIVSIRDRFPPSTPESRVILDLAPCKLR